MPTKRTRFEGLSVLLSAADAADETCPGEVRAAPAAVAARAGAEAEAELGGGKKKRRKKGGDPSRTPPASSRKTNKGGEGVSPAKKRGGRRRTSKVRRSETDDGDTVVASGESGQEGGASSGGGRSKRKRGRSNVSTGNASSVPAIKGRGGSTGAPTAPANIGAGAASAADDDDGRERCEICGKAVSDDAQSNVGPDYEGGGDGGDGDGKNPRRRRLPPGASLGGPVLRFEPFLPRPSPSSPLGGHLLPSESRPVTVHLSCASIAPALGRPDLVVGYVSNLASRYRSTAAPGFREAMSVIRKAGYGGTSFYLVREFEERIRRTAAEERKRRAGAARTAAGHRIWTTVPAVAATTNASWREGGGAPLPVGGSAVGVAKVAIVKEDIIVRGWPMARDASAPESEASDNEQPSSKSGGSPAAAGNGDADGAHRALVEDPGADGAAEGSGELTVREWPAASSGVSAPAPAIDNAEDGRQTSVGEDGGEEGPSEAHPPTEAHARYSSAVQTLLSLEQSLEAAVHALQRAQHDHDMALKDVSAGRRAKDAAAVRVVDAEIEYGTGEWWELYREMVQYKEQRGECHFGINRDRGGRGRHGKGRKKTSVAERKAGEDDGKEVVCAGFESDAALGLSEAEVGLSEAEGPATEDSGGDAKDATAAKDTADAKNGPENEEDGEKARYNRLRRFAAQCRSSRQRGQIDWIRQSALNRLGFEWREGEARWMSLYCALRDFKEREGHTEVRESEGGGYSTLAKWLREQRRLWRKRDKQGSEEDGKNDGADGDGDGKDGADSKDGGKDDAGDEDRGKGGGCLSDKRVRLLEALGVSRDLPRANMSKTCWKKRYEELTAFRSDNGHTDIPPNHALRRWVNKQRRLMRLKLEGGGEAEDSSSSRGGDAAVVLGDLISDERVRLLEEAGVAPEQKPIQKDKEEMEREEWTANYSQLREFHSENGHAKVPPDHPLCRWLGRQLRGWRSMLASGGKEKGPKKGSPSVMTEERAGLLGDLGLCVEDRVGACDVKWREKYSELRALVEENGHPDVPQDHPLRPWVKKQLDQLRKKGTGEWTLDLMSDERARLLSELGLTTSIRSATSIGGPNVCQEDSWRANFEKLREYRERWGDCNVPRKYEEEDLKLGTWVKCQRKRLKMYEQNELDVTGVFLERVKLLLELGLEAKPSMGGYQRRKSDEKWERSYQELVTFQSVHGHCNVPRKENRPLNSWADAQRNGYAKRREGKKSHLTDERITKLTSVGFNFSRPQMGWDDHFDLLVAFKREHGHTRVPARYRGHAKLGEWVRKQRELFANGEMPDPPRKNAPDELRLAKLRGIGFDFDKRRRGLAGRGGADDSKFSMPIRQMNILKNGCAW